MLSKVTGSWNLKFPSLSFKFVISNGKINIKGRPIQLLPSNNPRFPMSGGWLMFRYLSLTYYIQFSSNGIRAVEFKGGRVIPGKTITVTGGVVPGKN